MTFQEIISSLEQFWASRGCVIEQPYDLEVGAGTMCPGTFLRVLGPEPWRAAYVQPSRRADDGRYGENAYRLYRHYQYQVVLKPSPDEILQVVLHRGNFLLNRKKDVFGGDVGGLAQGGIVAGQNITPPEVESVRIFGASQNAVFHVINRKQAVVPLAGNPVLLAVDNKSAPFFKKGFQRLGDKKLQDHRLIFIVADQKFVFPKLIEGDLEQKVAVFFARRPDGCQIREFGLDGFN